MTKANDTCASPAVVDFSDIETTRVSMSFDSSGAALDHAPAFYCAGMVDLVVRVLDNPLSALRFSVSGGSGDLVLIGPLSAGMTCPVSGWAITTGGGGFSVNNVPLGTSQPPRLPLGSDAVYPDLVEALTRLFDGRATLLPCCSSRRWTR